MITAYDALWDSLVLASRIRNPRRRLPLIAYLIDWDKAAERTLDITDPQDLDAWCLLLNIGYRNDLAIRLVDPAIAPIVERMLQLPMLTFWSCAGHPPFDEDNQPYFGLVFTEAKFGHEFLKRCQDTYRGSGGITFTVGSFDSGQLPICAADFPTLPTNIISQTVDQRMPLFLNWHGIADARAAEEHWYTYSLVLHDFDRKGAHLIERPKLRERAWDLDFPGVPLPEEFQEIHRRLTGFTQRRNFLTWLKWHLFHQTHQ